MAPAFAAEPILRVESIPHAISNAEIYPNLMPGVAGVGIQEEGDTLPCMNCYAIPTDTFAIPPSVYTIAQGAQTLLIFYAMVESGNVSGAGTFSYQVVEETPGKLVQSATEAITLAPNATTILGFEAQLINGDGYYGPETVVYTTTVGGLTAQSEAYIWVVKTPVPEAEMLLSLPMPAIAAPAFAAGPILPVESIPHAISNADIYPNLMPGVTGVGYSKTDPLPCYGCYGVPISGWVLPPPYYIVAAYQAKTLNFYSFVDVGNVTGTATLSFEIIESATGKIALSTTGMGSLPANAVTLLGCYTGLPDQDGYEGLEDVVFTNTIGNLTVQSKTHIWVVDHALHDEIRR
jgi:hypothetical protein